MPTPASAPPTTCPGCAQPMRALALERRSLGTETVDLCAACQALWFDAYESVQLAPAATIELFRAIQASGPGERRPLPARLPCPRCGDALVLTQDMQRTTRFSYHRCPNGHGRFTPFFQFLREKSFVRPLAPDELARLRQSVRTVRCSGCGAPIDLETATACPYCGAPITILDPQAVAHALAELSAASAATPAPLRTVDVDMLALQFATAQLAEQTRAREQGETGLDLLGAGFDALLAWWNR